MHALFMNKNIQEQNAIINVQLFSVVISTIIGKNCNNRTSVSHEVHHICFMTTPNNIKHKFLDEG